MKKPQLSKVVFEELSLVALVLGLTGICLWVVARLGAFRLPAQAWEWMFFVSILFSTALQSSLSFHQQRNEVFESIRRGPLLRYALFLSPWVNGTLVFVAIIASTNDGMFNVHMLTMVAYMSYGALLHWLVCRAPDKTNVDAADWKNMSRRLLFTSDLPAAVGLVLLWAVVWRLWGSVKIVTCPADMILVEKIPETANTYSLVHVIMSGALGLYMFITGLVYLAYRCGLPNRASGVEPKPSGVVAVDASEHSARPSDVSHTPS